MAYTVYTIYTIPSSRISSTEKFPLFFLSHVFWGLFPDANIKIIESKTLFNLKLKETSILNEKKLIKGTNWIYQKSTSLGKILYEYYQNFVTKCI